ncbi:MAG: AMP-binding protein [Bacteroidetes bacterium]|nr:AMP-binding protein [Bacteroidota bacterium]
MEKLHKEQSKFSKYKKHRDKFDNIIDLIEYSCSEYKDLIAYENLGKKLSFKEVNQLSKNFANYLLNNKNLKKGDKIAIQMPNILQYPIALFGALRAGLIVVNINPLYTPEEMLFQLKDSEVKGIIILDNFAYKLEGILGETKIEEIIITSIGDLMGSIKGYFLNQYIKYFKKMVPKYNLPNSINFKKCLEIGKKEIFIQPEINNDELAFIQYTTGTTGIAKGAMLTHNNIIANISQVLIWLEEKIEYGKEIAISPLPLYHIFSLIVSFILLKCGIHNILITNPRDLKSFIKDLRKYPFNLLTGVNTLFKALLNEKKFDKVDFSDCKLVIGGAATIQESVAKEWNSKTKTSIIEAYGLTEASPAVTANPIDKPYYNTIGKPFIDTQIKIIDEFERELNVGEKGELIVKGPQVMQGYWNKKQETEKVLINGWLKTGDIGILDEKGFVRIVDRKKDIVNISGFNVYPNEIDNVATKYPKVLEAATIGIPDEKSGEALKLFVVKKDLSLTEEELIKFCRQKLTGYKIPKFIEFKNKLPKSAVGKISKKDLKEIELNKINQFVDLEL